MLKIILSLLLVVLLVSCKTEANKKYNEALWVHKTRMLDLEYAKKLSDIKQHLETQLFIKSLDSVKYDTFN